MRRFRVPAALAAAAALAAPAALQAANHREAPITALDHKADITDVYAFVSYRPGQAPGTPPRKVTLMFGVDPLIDPGNGPTHFPFDPSILYAINVDNDHDAMPDVVFEFRFSTEYQLPGVFTGLAGFGPNGAPKPGTSTLVVPPRITSFDNPGLNQRQRYTVSVFRPDKGRVMLSNADGTPLFAVPANAGPRTMDYAALYAAGTYRNLVATPATLDAAEAKVFAGTTNDGFWIDLGGTFDTLNLRTLGSGVPGVLTAAEDAAQRNFAPDFVSGFAVNTLAVEVPIEWLTSDGRRHRATDPEATIGVWATTSRQATLVRRPNITIPPTGTDAVPVNTESGPFRQVQRMGNPLVNELLIGIRFKDKFSIRPPQFDFEYINFLLDPVLVRIAEALYGAAGVRLAVPPPPRTDLLPLVHYLPPIAAPDTPPGPIADLLRLNTGVPATPPGSPGFSRLGLLGRDGAGFPNGRRLTDDVVDVTLRVVVGGVLNPTFPGYTPGIHDRLGDGVNVDDVPYQPSFPYIGFCPPGANRVHCDPGERGCGPLVN